jgi:hypothetical protein
MSIKVVFAPRMPRDEATVDRIFAGNLDELPPLSSKVLLLDDYMRTSV